MVGLGRKDAAGQQAHLVIVVVLAQPLVDSLPVQGRRVHHNNCTGNGGGVYHQGHGHFLYFGAQITQLGNGADDRLANLRIYYLGVNPLFDHPDFQAANIAVQRRRIIRHRRIPSIRVFGVMAGDCFQRHGAIGNGAGNGSGGIHRPGRTLHTVPADPSPGGPNPYQTAESCRPADRSAGVFAQRSGA